MALQTHEEYYSDSKNWGKYQFVSISEIMDDLMLETTDPDSYLVNIPRHKILKTLKDGVRNVNKATRKVIEELELTVPPSGYLVLPQNYYSWVRVSVIDSSGHSNPLDMNNDIPTAETYLQDNDYNIITDSDGRAIRADGNNAYAESYKKTGFVDSVRAGYQTLDTSKLSRNGEFKIDEKRGLIVFSSDLKDRDVVLEYLSDGLDLENLREEEVLVHKSLKDAVFEYAYAYCIATRRNVPYNEKLRSKNSYKTLLHQAKIDSADFDINQIIRVSRTSTKI